MKRIGLRFPRPLRFVLWLVLTTSFLTGVSWFALHRWVRVEGEFGPGHSAWEPIIIRIHGGAAMAAMVGFGYILATHVTVARRAKRNRLLGSTLVGAIGFMILTGWGLYYCGAESWRNLISWAHLGSGLSLPALLSIHIWTGHRSASRGS